jgi:hypothetical protein
MQSVNKDKIETENGYQSSHLWVWDPEYGAEKMMRRLDLLVRLIVGYAEGGVEV